MNENNLRVSYVSLQRVKDNPYQPRKRYPKQGIKDLADNIAERGLLQPISVIQTGKDDNPRYVIIAGHRRFRAFKMNRSKEIPVIIRKKSTQKDMVLDLAVENALRKDFSPIEKAQAIFQVLCTLPAIKNNLLYAYTLVTAVKLWEHRGVAPCTQGIAAEFQNDDIFECRMLLRLIGMSGTNATTYLRLLELDLELQSKVITSSNQNENRRLMAEGFINIKQAYELTRLKSSKLRKQVYKMMIEEQWTSIRLKYIVDELLERGAEMQRHSGLGSTKSKMKKDEVLLQLSKKCFNLASRVYNSRNIVKNSVFSIEKATVRASIIKLRADSIRLARVCSETLREDDNIEISNIDFELVIRKAGKKRGAHERRYSLPAKITKSNKLQPGDKIVAKIIGIIRANKVEDEDDEDYEATMKDLIG